jgi:hypothetical protein
MTDRGVDSRDDLVKRFGRGKAESLNLDLLYHLKPYFLALPKQEHSF